ncbi:MAG: hypothetical protein SOW38_04795 [Succinivibrio sp.]|nr:hypothetical protein [Succinivibrio sp.]
MADRIVENWGYRVVTNKDLTEAVNNLEQVKTLIRQTMAQSQKANQ